jgi:hypothetical protein
VAAQAFLAEFLGRTAAASVEGRYVLLGGIVGMFVGCLMTGLAIILALPDFRMVGSLEACHWLFMTTDTISPKFSRLGHVRPKKLAEKSAPHR